MGLALVQSAPQGDVAIVRSENDNQGDGQFSWAFETSDGTKAEQQGELKSGPLEDGTDGKFETMKGQYSYVAPDGKFLIMFLIVSERFFVPQIYLLSELHSGKNNSFLPNTFSGRNVLVTYEADERGYRAKTTIA
jgi:hypothetical protein